MAAQTAPQADPGRREAAWDNACEQRFAPTASGEGVALKSSRDEERMSGVARVTQEHGDERIRLG